MLRKIVMSNNITNLIKIGMFVDIKTDTDIVFEHCKIVDIYLWEGSDNVLIMLTDSSHHQPFGMRKHNITKVYR